MGTFTPVIWSTIAWTEKLNNGLCTHFLQLRGLKSSHNSSRLKNCRCELSLMEKHLGPNISQEIGTKDLDLLFNYRPQWSCGQGNIFTPVCHSVHGGVLPQCMLGYPPGPDPPRADTPTGTRPPGSRPPSPREQPPPPPGSRLQHTVYERPVRILLECILVFK